MNRKTTMVGLVLLTAATAMAGIEFTSKVSDERGRAVSSTRGWVDGSKAKIEEVSGRGSGGMEKGSYILSKDGGKTIYMVDPQNKSYLKMDIDQLASQVGQFMNAAGAFVKLEFTNPKFKTISDERGPKMYGLPTRHVKTETSYTVEASVFGRKNITVISRKDEIWLTKKLRDSGLQIWTQQRTIKTGNENIDKIIKAETKRLDGIPLKITSVTTTRENNDEPEVTTVTHEITSLKKAGISAEVFEIPADYKNNNEKVASGLEAITKGLQEGTDSRNEGSPAQSINSFMNGIFGSKK
jgi:hypothetical protein